MYTKKNLYSHNSTITLYIKTNHFWTESANLLMAGNPDGLAAHAAQKNAIIDNTLCSRSGVAPR